MLTLNGYINEVRQKPFKLYEHDCFIFTNRCWEITHGKPWFEYSGNYGDIIGRLPELDSLFKVSERPVKNGLVSTRSMQAHLTGACFGFCIGSKSIFVGYKGLIFLPSYKIDKCWIND